MPAPEASNAGVLGQGAQHTEEIGGMLCCVCCRKLGSSGLSGAHAGRSRNGKKHQAPRAGQRSGRDWSGSYLPRQVALWRLVGAARCWAGPYCSWEIGRSHGGLFG